MYNIYRYLTHVLNLLSILDPISVERGNQYKNTCHQEIFHSIYWSEV